MARTFPAGAGRSRGAHDVTALLTVIVALAAGTAAAAELPRAKPESVGFSGARLAKLDEAMHALVDQGALVLQALVEP